MHASRLCGKANLLVSEIREPSSCGRQLEENKQRELKSKPPQERSCLQPPSFMSTISDASPQRAIKPPSSIEPFRVLERTSFWKFLPGGFQASDMHVTRITKPKLSPKLRSSVSLSLSVVLLPPLVLAIYLSFCLPIYVLLLLAIYLPTCPPVSLYHECMELS